MIIKEVTLTAPVINANPYTPCEIYEAYENNTEYRENDRVSYNDKNYAAKNTFKSSTSFNERDWIELKDADYCYLYLPNMYIATEDKIYRCLVEHYSVESFDIDDPDYWEEIGDNIIGEHEKWVDLNTLVDNAITAGGNYMMTNTGGNAFNYVFSAEEPTEDIYGNVCANRSQIYWTHTGGSMYVRLDHPGTYDFTALGLDKNHKTATFVVEEV